ncbi:MAG: glycosyl hydrolase [Gemmatimonadetes bacterium]|nr:glycosyl hydrolase [Gemmatimonadota bacterium]
MMRTLSLVGAGLLLATSVGQTQTVDSSYFQGKSWRNIGPNRGGRSIAGSGSPSRPNEYYFGAVGGGLWKTTDGGLSWRPVTDGQIKSSSVGGVAVSESNPDVVYIGMGETEFRGNIMQGDGVYKSLDGGKTWKPAGLGGVQAIARVRVDPMNPDLVYVAAFGKPYAPSSERGVFRSKDGGKHWERVLFRNDSTAAVDLTIDPRNPNVLYASLWQAYRTPWKSSSGGVGSGLFKSTDGGDTWTELTRNPGMPKGLIGKIGVTASGAAPNRVWAIIENDSGGVFRSDDAGATWKRVNQERKLRQRAFYYSRIYADPKLKDRVYVLNVDFHRSDDGGVTFKNYDAPHGDYHDLWIDPNNNQRILNSSDGGGSVTVNGGATWTSLAYPTAQAYRVATTKDFPYHVCGAQQDNSTFCVAPAGWDHLTGLMAPGDFMYDVGGGESGYIAPDPRNSNVFFAGSQGALLTRYDRSNGQIRDVQVYPRFFSGEPASALPERWQWTYPIVFSPIDPNVIYTSSQHLWKTVNDGQSWDRISPDLTRADPNTLGLSGGPITHDMNGPEIYGTIFSIAPSFHDINTIWTGSDDGLVQITRDGGTTWKNITPKDLPAFARISLIEASRHQPGTAYVAAKRYQLDDRAPYVFKTTDYGTTWTKTVDGIRADAYVHAVREDPKRPGLLYAGTEHGIYVSWDAGTRWQSLSLNLPDVQIPDLVVEENDLVIATHGRSMWLLEDIGFLRELGPGIAKQAVALFGPRTAVRGVYPASVHYYLERPADTVRLEVLDQSGAVIRSFVGLAKVDSTQFRADSAALDRMGCDVRPRPQPMPPGKAGLNRFVWDGRYEGSAEFLCMIMWGARPEAGPVAPPGTYQIRLTAAGVTKTTPFEVRRDPRLIGVTDDDLKAQFRLASSIRDQEDSAIRAVIRIRAIKDAIDDRVAKAPALATAAAGLKQKLTAIEDELYQGRSRSSQDLLNFPIRLSNRMAALRRSIESGDAKPTDGALVVFKELATDLGRHLTALGALMAADLEGFNRQLAGRKLEPVT